MAKALEEAYRGKHLDSQMTELALRLEQSREILDTRDGFSASFLRDSPESSKQLDEALSMIAESLGILQNVFEAPTASATQREKATCHLSNLVALVISISRDSSAGQDQRDAAVRLFQQARKLALAISTPQTERPVSVRPAASEGLASGTRPSSVGKPRLKIVK